LKGLLAAHADEMEEVPEASALALADVDPPADHARHHAALCFLTMDRRRASPHLLRSGCPGKLKWWPVRDRVTKLFPNP